MLMLTIGMGHGVVKPMIGAPLWRIGGLGCLNFILGLVEDVAHAQRQVGCCSAAKTFPMEVIG